MESAIKDEVSYSMECGDEEPENSVTVRGIKGRVGAELIKGKNLLDVVLSVRRSSTPKN